MTRCNIEAVIIANYLDVAINNGCFNFRYKLVDDSDGNNWELSICIPPDGCGNRLQDNTEYPTMIETLLFKNNNMTYSPEWEYEDVCRWYSETRASSNDNILKIVAEIQRLNVLIEEETGDSEEETEVVQSGDAFETGE